MGVAEALAGSDEELGTVENTTEGRFEVNEKGGTSSYGRGVSG